MIPFSKEQICSLFIAFGILQPLTSDCMLKQIFAKKALEATQSFEKHRKICEKKNHPSITFAAYQQQEIQGEKHILEIGVLFGKEMKNAKAKFLINSLRYVKSQQPPQKPTC